MWNPFKKKSDSFDDDGLDSPFSGEGKYPPGADPMQSPFPSSNDMGSSDPFSRPDPLGTPSFPPSMGQQEQMPSFPSQEPMRPTPNGFGNPRPILSEERPLPSVPPVQQSNTGDKMEVVIAKLDSLRSMMDVMNQRIANLENKLGNNNNRQW